MGRPKKLPKVLTDDEKERLLARFNVRYPTPHRNRTMALTMLLAGLRVSEVVGLRVEHLDPVSMRITIRDGKGSKDRVVPCARRLRTALSDWLSRRADWLADPEGCAWVFPTRNGGQIDTRQVRATVKREALRAGVAEADRVSPHTLRHTFASDLYAKEKDIRLVQDMLGHSSIQTTEIYTHLVNGEAEEAMRTFGDPPEPEASPEGMDALVEALSALEDPAVGALQAALDRLGRKS